MVMGYKGEGGVQGDGWFWLVPLGEKRARSGRGGLEVVIQWAQFWTCCSG